MTLCVISFHVENCIFSTFEIINHWFLLFFSLFGRIILKKYDNAIHKIISFQRFVRGYTRGYTFFVFSFYYYATAPKSSTVLINFIVFSAYAKKAAPNVRINGSPVKPRIGNTNAVTGARQTHPMPINAIPSA